MSCQSSANRIAGEHRSSALRVSAAAVLAAAIATVATPAVAQVRVGDAAEGVRLELQNASVDEVLAALGKTFAVRYRSAAKLEKQLTGTYQGSLPGVVRRVLDGYSFVVKSSPTGLEIDVVASGNGTGPPPASISWKAAPLLPVPKLVDGSTPPTPLPLQGPGPIVIPQPLPSSVAPPAPLPSGAIAVGAPAPQTSTVPFPTVAGARK